MSDPEKKKLYDQFGHAAFDGSAPDPDSFTRGGAGNGGFREFHFEQGNMDDIFGDIFSGIFHGKEDAGRGFSFHGFGGDGFTGHGADGRDFTGSGFGSHGFGGNGFAGGDVRMKGQDIQAQVEVSFDEPLNIDYDGNELLLSDILGTDDDVVTKEFEKKENKRELLEAMSTLKERERQILQMRYGIQHEELTQKDIAKRLGISQSYISRLEKRIIAKLKVQMKNSQ